MAGRRRMVKFQIFFDFSSRDLKWFPPAELQEVERGCQGSVRK